MFTQDPHNANLGTKDGQKLLKTSIEECGIGRPILVDANNTIIAGNKTAGTVSVAPEDVEVIETTGDELVVVQRTDLDARSDGKAKRLAILDNRTAEVNLDWNSAELKALAAAVGSELIGFSTDELDAVSMASSEDLTTNPNIDLENIRCSVGPFRFYVTQDELAAFSVDLAKDMEKTGLNAQAIISKRLGL